MLGNYNIIMYAFVCSCHFIADTNKLDTVNRIITYVKKKTFF